MTKSDNDSDKISRAKSLHSNKTKKKTNPIMLRIDFIKNLLRNKSLKPIVDFDATATENFIHPNDHKSRDYDSHDTRFVLSKKTQELEKIISEIGGKLFYIKSGTTGHTFRGEGIDDEGNPFNYALKVTAFTKKEKYGKRNDVTRPENAELLMSKVLSYFVAKKLTQHIVLPIGTFDTSINYFVDLIDKEVVKEDNKKFKEFVEKYEDGAYYDTVSILISEWANRGDFLEFVKKYYERFTLETWQVFFFQVLSVLAVIQAKFPAFRHNDLKANNILVHKTSKKMKKHRYKINCHIYDVPNIGFILKMCDFDFACIPGVVDNKKVYADWTTEIGVVPKQNRYYDMHYFFNTLIKKGFCPEIMTSSKVPTEVKEFVTRIVPKKYQNGKDVAVRGRILIDKEFTTPNEVLQKDPFFASFRNIEKTKQFKETIEKHRRLKSNDRQKIPIFKSYKSSENRNSSAKPIIKKSNKKEESIDQMINLLVDDKTSKPKNIKPKIPKKSKVKLDKILISDSSSH